MNTKSKTDEMEVDDAVSICRLCAEMTSSKSFMPLFTDDKQEQPVTKQINQLIVNLVSRLNHCNFQYSMEISHQV